jgi:hypothetical protein
MQTLVTVLGLLSFLAFLRVSQAKSIKAGEQLTDSMSRLFLNKLIVAQLVTPRLLWYPKVHYRAHNDLYPDTDKSSPHPSTLHLRSVLIPSSPLRLGLLSGLFPSGQWFPKCGARPPGGGGARGAKLFHSLK